MRSGDVIQVTQAIVPQSSCGSVASSLRQGKNSGQHGYAGSGLPFVSGRNGAAARLTI
jgi:hypothetical protein